MFWNNAKEFKFTDKRNLNDTGIFFNLPQTVGCPDCADGGAEWIEIELSSGKKHKETFEYLNEPEVLKSYVEELRMQLGRSGQCED